MQKIWLVLGGKSVLIFRPTFHIHQRYKTTAILEMMIEKGFKEGFAMTLNNLEKLLTSLSQK